jgi:hypothetical protein
VGDDVQRQAAVAGGADLPELEERRPRHQLPVADGGEQRRVPPHGHQPGCAAAVKDGGGEVDELAAFAPGAGGDRDVPAAAGPARQ